MRILSIYELKGISGSLQDPCVNVNGKIITLTVPSGSEFQIDGYTFSTVEGMVQGGIYNGYQVMFAHGVYSAEGTTFILTPIKR